ncbi:hypothetical protein ACTGJ9_023400 [Bradyrhizobium sp. RDM12]
MSLRLLDVRRIERQRHISGDAAGFRLLPASLISSNASSLQRCASSSRPIRAYVAPKAVRYHGA